MKKVFIFLTALVVFASCSLKQNQKNVLDSETAILTPEDAHLFASQMHISLRSGSAGSSVYYPEIMADFFHPSSDYGNRMGIPFRWQWQSDYDFAESVWSAAYSYINHALFYLEAVEKLDTDSWRDEDKQDLNYDKGLAYFTQAYFGFRLCQFYCNHYNGSNGGDYGIPIVRVYNPTGDVENYPGRNTLQESYDWVIENLTSAREYLASFTGVEGSTKLTVDIVDALWARVALEMENYDDAIEKSTSLISGGKYPLLETADDMTALWTNDSGKECIMQFYADLGVNSIPSSNDPGYVSLGSNGLYRPDWILANGVTALYNPNDLRLAWYENVTVTMNQSSGNATLFNKFPGNMSLQSSTATSSHIQKPKPFRIAEQYLIAAEAYASKGGNDAAASAYLNQLLDKRVPGETHSALSGAELKTAIKEERIKELIGEGFRFWDLKRYGEGMNRSLYTVQNDGITDKGGANAQAINMTVAANNSRWLMPIPQTECDANPQIREQQNPGY